MDTNTKEIADTLNEFTGTVNKRLTQLDDAIVELAQGRELAKDGGGSRSPLAKISGDPSVMALRNGQTKSAIIQLKSSIPMLTKSGTLVGDEDSSGTDLFSGQAQRMPGLANDPRRALSLFDVMRRLPVTAGSFEYNALNGYSNAAAHQALQGDEKAQATVPTELKTASISTIAHWVEASKQVLDDTPALQGAISDLLRYGVLAKLESAIVAGAGGTGEISGLTDTGNFTSLSTSATDTLADAVARAQAELAVNGWGASAVLVHPHTWREARIERADSGAGVYVAGDWSAPSAPSIWGTPVIQTPAVSQNDVIVFDATQTLLLDRQDVTIEVGRVQSQFTANTLTLLAEMRAGLAVLSAGAVMYGTLSS